MADNEAKNLVGNGRQWVTKHEELAEMDTKYRPEGYETELEEQLCLSKDLLGWQRWN